MGLQRTPNDRFHVVTSIEAEQTGFDTHAMFYKLGQSRLDRLGYRLGVPWSGHPIRVEPDDEDAR